MRVALVAPYFHPHVGGVESHVADVARELARRGHAVTVVTSRLAGTAPHERRHGYEVRRVRTRGILFSTPIAPGLAAELGAIDRLDLIHSHSPPPLASWQAARAAGRLGVPHVLTHHCDLEIPLPGGAGLVELYRRTFERATLARTARVVATTRTYAATSRSLWRRPASVIPNPVDPERFTPDADAAEARERLDLAGRRVALFVGRLTHHKGVEEFVRAAEFTAPDVAHVVVGDGPRRARLEALARAAPAGKVVFAGAAERRELPGLYAACDVFCLPSTSRLEAFGIAALEAMATEKPVVLSNIPGVAELVDDGVNGLLADPVNARDLAAKMHAILDDAEAARAMGKRGRARVLERFTLRAVVDQLEQVYREVAEKQGLPGG